MASVGCEVRDRIAAMAARQASARDCGASGVRFGPNNAVKMPIGSESVLALAQSRLTCKELISCAAGTVRSRVRTNIYNLPVGILNTLFYHRHP